LYSVQAAQYDNAPQSIRVAAALPFSQMEIHHRDSVWVNGGALHIGQIAIDLSFIVPWQPILPDFPSGAVLQRLEQNIHLVRQTIGRFGKSGGLRELWFDPHPGGKQGIYAAPLKERATLMLTALRAQDIAGAYQAGCTLICLAALLVLNTANWESSWRLPLKGRLGISARKCLGWQPVVWSGKM